MSTIRSEHFTQTMLRLLDEAFDNVYGYFLDKHTSLFETLSGITAEEASIPVGGKCATLAAQVRHVAFFLDVNVGSTRDPNYPPVDWGEIWRTVNRVNADEWKSIQDELRTSYGQVLELINETTQWTDDEIGGILAVLAHTAYHLGEIRQALCTLKP